MSITQLGELLERFNQSANIGIADLGRLLVAVEAEAAQHRFATTTCANVMTTGLITVRSDTPLPEAARLFRSHAIKSLPVVDPDMRLRGLVLQGDLLKAMELKVRQIAPWQRSSRLTVSEVLRPAVRAVPHDPPVGALLNRPAARESEVVPVTKDGRLVRILTRSDIIGLLLQGTKGRPAA